MFRFHGELNDFLPHEQRKKVVVRHFRGNPSVKHLVEALQVPHTEVGRILANDQMVDFSYLVQNGDSVDVHPAPNEYPGGRDFASEPGPGFVLDNHLGKLATYLRIFGFDTLYRNDFHDDELANIACRDGRILLTRDRGLLMRKVISRGYCVRNKDPRQQIYEVVRRFDLLSKIQPFNRCLKCNSVLQPVEKQEILHRLEPLTRLYYNEFYICPDCDQVFWKGSHYERMKRFLDTIRNGG